MEEVKENLETQAPKTPSYTMNDDGDYVLESGETTDAKVAEEAKDETPQEEAVALGETVEEVEKEKPKEEVEEEIVELGQVAEEVEEEPEVKAEEPDTDFELPEGWNKMIDFLKENPGATPEDYVNIKKGSDQYSDEELLKQKLAKENGLDLKEDSEEINFLYEDTYAYDADLDEERDINLKKVLIKKSLKEAKAEVSKQQEEYLGNLTFKDQRPEVKEALKFQKEQKEAESKTSAIREGFVNSTNELFSDDFKGFEFKYGDSKSQKIKVGKVSEVKEFQSDVNNFFNKHVGKDGSIKNVESYHKALWAADNVDAIVSHFYEQGRADAVRSAAKASKNIDMGSRQDVGSITNDDNKPKFRLVDDNDDSFKFKR